MIRFRGQVAAARRRTNGVVIPDEDPGDNNSGGGSDPTTITPFAYGATGATNSTLRATLNASNTGTASSNDRTAINTAIANASAAGGGIVQLNPGIYSINGGRIEMRSNVMLRGVRTQGSEPSVVLKAGTNFLSNSKWSGYSVITVADWGYENMTVKDVLCDQSGNTLDGNINGRLSAYLCEFREASNVVMDGVYTRNPFTYSLVMVNCTQFGIRNSNVQSDTIGKYDQLDGIHILQGSRGDVVDNRVDNGAGGRTADGDDGLVAHTISQVCHDVNYRNNWVRGGRHGSGIQLAGGSHDIYNITIQNNTFIGTSTPEGVYFGYYDTADSSIYNITVGGGAGLGNYFEDTSNFCVDLTNGPCRNSTVSHNTSLRSGSYLVPSGNGNVVSANT